MELSEEELVRPPSTKKLRKPNKGESTLIQKKIGKLYGPGVYIQAYKLIEKLYGELANPNQHREVGKSIAVCGANIIKNIIRKLENQLAQTCKREKELKTAFEALSGSHKEMEEKFKDITCQQLTYGKEM